MRIYFIFNNTKRLATNYTLSGRIGKAVALHAEAARSIPGRADTALIYILCTRCSEGTAHEGGGCDQ